MYKIGLSSFKRSVDFTLGNSLFRAIKLAKNIDFHKYKYPGYGSGFDVNRAFTLSLSSGFVTNVIIFGAYKNSSVHIENKKNDILILGKGPTQRLDNTILTVEKTIQNNFSEQQKELF